MKKKILIGAIIIAVITGGVVWRTSYANSQSQAAVQTITLKKTNLLDSILVSGTVVSSNSKNVYSKAASYPVKEIYFKVGDKVKAGDVLAVLDTTTLELDIKQTELNIKNAEAALKNEENSNKYNLQTAENNVQSSAIELKNAQDSYDKVKKLYDEGKSTQEELTKAETTLKKAQLSYNNAQAALNNTKSQNTTTAKNSLESQKATLEKQRKTLNDAKIVAPIDGTVTMINAQVGAAANGLLFLVEDTDNLIISTSIGEYDIASVKLGQEVIIKADSTGDKEFTGTISKIAPTAAKDANGNTASTSNVEFDTEILLKGNDSNIKIGMNVRLTIKLNEKKDVYALPYDSIITETDGSEWIYVVDESKEGSKSENNLKKIKVQKGMETDMYVEVSSPDLRDNMKVQNNPENITETAK